MIVKTEFGNVDLILLLEQYQYLQVLAERASYEQEQINGLTEMIESIFDHYGWAEE